jgi:hypothetical protein
MNQGRLRKTAIAAFVGLAGVLGFGSGNVAVAAQEQPNACELLTRKEARRILGRSVRRETNITGTEASSCSYVVTKDAKRVLGLGVGELASKDEASKAYTAARANAQFDGLKVHHVRRLGNIAHWLPKTNNFERKIGEEQVALGELTVLDGRRVYTVFIAPPSKTKARDAIELVISD